MEYKDYLDVKNYLTRFDEILNQMANKMLDNNIIGNITLDFIRCMVPHHQAAIYMCENLLKYTNYQPLQSIAKGIISMQQKGIEQMKEIARTTKNYENSKLDVNSYIEKYFEITKNMINKMRNSKRIMDINLDFISEMIPHHEGAIAMCNNLLKYRIDPRLDLVAKNIIQEQSKGVMQLKDIKINLYKK